MTTILSAIVAVLALQVLVLTIKVNKLSKKD